MAVFIDERCSHQSYWLILFVGIFACVCSLVSIPSNAMVLLAILRNSKFHTNFHYIVFNICLANFLIGTILCPLAADVHLGALGNQQNNYGMNAKQHVFRFGLSFLGIVCLLSMTVLGIDRMISLKLPIRYREMRRRYFITCLVCVWILPSILSPVYFHVPFTLYLMIIATTTVFITSVVMVVTYILYRERLNDLFTRTNTTKENSESKSLTSESKSLSSETSERKLAKQDNAQSKVVQSLRKKISEHIKRESNASYVSVNQTNNQEDIHSYQMEKRVTNTFFCILVGFLICYLPLVGLSLYLHICKNCSCETLEIVQEVVGLVVMASSFFLTMIFLIRLTALRKSCFNLLLTKKQVEKRWRAESIPVTKTKRKESLKEKLFKKKSYEHSKKQKKETAI